MGTTRERVALLNGAITGIAARADDTRLPLMVFIHGGGTSAKAADVPGYSQLGLAAANGFAAFALNRPGQADSAALDLDPMADSGAFAANAERLDQALAELWERHAGNAPGIVLNASSIGGAIALHLAARWSAAQPPSWPLLGLSLSDIGQRPREPVIEAWRSLPPQERIDIGQHAGALPRPPPWTVPPNMLALARVLEPALRAELQEIVGGWTRDWAGVCAQVRVPVHYRLAEHDTLWQVSHALVTEMADALRKASPYVDADIFQGASHGVALTPVGVSYDFEVLAFAHRCAAFARTPQLLGGAGGGERGVR
jgi:hypothetical protein